jgi:hypothetical protein
MYGLGNRIIPFKGRTIDLTKKVKVYRNLTRKGRFYSIKQGNHVVGSTDCVMLCDVVFTISKATQQRVRIKKQRNVHAYAVGYIALEGGLNTTAEQSELCNKPLELLITYNPYNDDEFRVRETDANPTYVYKAKYAIFNKFGLSISRDSA